MSGRDRTIQDLQKRIDTMRSELEGERAAAGMERQETARCRQEHVQLANKIAQLENDVMTERQRAVAGGHAAAGSQQYVLLMYCRHTDSLCNPLCAGWTRRSLNATRCN